MKYKHGGITMFCMHIDVERSRYFNIGSIPKLFFFFLLLWLITSFSSYSVFIFVTTKYVNKKSTPTKIIIQYIYATDKSHCIWVIMRILCWWTVIATNRVNNKEINNHFIYFWCLTSRFALFLQDLADIRNILPVSWLLVIKAQNL